MRREKPKQAVFFLIGELLRTDRLPPVTLLTIALNVIIYLELFDFEFPSLDSVCLSANEVINFKHWNRLILSQFFHADDWHLYYNMISFSIKGRSLERRFGSKYFFILLLIFILSCNCMYVAIQIVASYLFQNNSPLSNCAVGFSGMLTFANLFSLSFIFAYILV
jgi:rhomboid domain-containing protein 1